MRISSWSSIRTAALIAAAAAAPAWAQTIGNGAPTSGSGPFGLDSSNPGSAFGAFAETFTLPAGSGLLQAFSLYLMDNSGGAALTVQASIFQFATDHITGPALYSSGNAGSTNLSGFDQLTFTGVDLALAPGTVYAVLLRPDASSLDGTNLFGVVDPDAFPLGQLFVSLATSDADLATDGAFFASDETSYGSDAAISLTFAPAAVTTTPEPASVVLVATGVVGILGVSRRRRRAMGAAASVIPLL